MPSKEEYLDYVLSLLSEIDSITYKKMMGEYLLYNDGVLFGGIYDDRFLIKKTKYTQSFGFKEEIPYTNAKAMYLIDIENRNEIKKIIENMTLELRDK